VTEPSKDKRSSEGRRWLKFPRFRWFLLGGLAILALLWLAPTITAFLADLDIEEVSRPYLVIFSFVVFDAVIPIFPSESLLTTASNLAAQEGSDLNVWYIALAGAAGAIVGDTLLYWLSRTLLRNAMSKQLEKAKKNEKVTRTLEVLGATAPLLIVAGRFVPGMRFVVTATMGLGRYSYPRFLLWDAIGGTFWAFYTCGFSYLVGTAIDDKPLLSIAISVLVTTALLGLLYVPIKRGWETTASP
jgi:membrane-associated protein